MTVEYTQRQKISAVEIGWSGISINDLIIAINEGSINKSYIKHLEDLFNINRDTFLKELKEISDLPTQIKAITGMSFREISELLYKKINDALSGRYKDLDKIKSIDYMGKSIIYRDPSTKEIVEIFGSNCNGETVICVNSTDRDFAKRLILERMVETPHNGFSINTNKIKEGLDNLTIDAQPHGKIFLDSKTKGLIKTSPGYDGQIPDRIIETTNELDGHEVINYLRDYLQEHKLIE